jgi:sugar phosphate isomerase/epimerase
LLPGNTLIQKWDAARKFGFAGIELRGHGDFAFEKRLPELLAAKKAGVNMPTVCVIMDHFIGDFDKTRRADAVANMSSLLRVMGELEGVGAITPAAYGLHSNYLPPFKSPRSDKDTKKVLMDGLSTLGNAAKKAGVLVLYEPLNRYEDFMCNTVAQAVATCRALGHESVKVMADLFHMSIEESDSSKALKDNMAWVAHIHVADSNRLEPGKGHTDFAAVFAALKRAKYKGYMAYECMLSDTPEKSLRWSMRNLKKAMK